MTFEIAFYRLLSFLVSAALFYQARALRRKHGSWLAPSALFSGYWGLMTIVPILLVQDADFFAGTAAAFVFASAFSIGSLCFVEPATEHGAQRLGLYDTRFLRISLIVTVVGALVCLMINSRVQGISFDRIFSFEAAAEYTENRYSGSIVTNIFLSLATVLAYVAAANAGMLLGGSGRMAPLIVLVGLSPTLFVLVTQSAKGALPLAAAIMAAGHFIRQIDARKPNLLSRASAKNLALVSLLIAPLLLVSFMARGLYGPISASELNFQLYRYFISYSAGHLVAFDDWVRSYLGLSAQLFYIQPDTKVGFYTFMSIARALGDMTPVPLGTYDEYFAHSDVLQSNIYTMYRGLVVDFTALGAIVFMFFSGIVAQAVYLTIAGQRYKPTAVAAYIVIIAATQQSAYISLFQYNSAFAFAAALAAILYVNYQFRSKNAT